MSDRSRELMKLFADDTDDMCLKAEQNCQKLEEFKYHFNKIQANFA